MRGLAEYILFAISLGATMALFTGYHTLIKSGTVVIVDTQQYEHVLDAASVTGLVESCFLDGKDYISTQFLEQNSGKDICQVCSKRFPNLCRIKTYVTVTKLPENKAYSFGLPLTKASTSYEFYVNIGDGENVGVGKLVLKI